MKEEERSILAEMFFTCGLLCACAFLVQRQVALYSPLLIIGLACGFAFSWLMRDKTVNWLNSATGAGVVAVLFWLAFAFFNSSFVYRDVVAVCLKGMIGLIIILSFNAASPRVLSDIQVLSLPLFMGHAVWLRQYSGSAALAVLAYLGFGALILKIKFRVSFKAVAPGPFQGNRSFFILILFFFCSLAGAWLIASNFKKADLSGGILREAGSGGDSRVEETDKRYYELQDKLQERMKGLLLSSRPGRASADVFSSLSVLVNDGSTPFALDMAEQALADFIQGSADIQGDEMIILEESVDRKIESSAGKLTEGIRNSLKKNPFNVKERMDILDRINRFEDQDSSSALSHLERNIQDVIERSSFDPGLKKEISEAVAALKDWKSLGLYREKNKSLKARAEVLKKGLKEEMSKLLAQVNKARDPADPGKITGEIERLKKELSGDARDIVKGIKESLDLKAGLITSEEFRKSGERIKSSGLSEEDQKAVQKGMDKLKKSRDPRDFLKRSGELKRVLEDNDLQSDAAIEKSVEALRERFISEEKNRIAAALEGSSLPDNGEKILKAARGMESSGTTRGLDNSAGKAKGLVDDAKRKGFISEESAGDIKGDIDGLAGLIAARKGFISSESSAGRENESNAFNGLAEDQKDGFAQGDKDGSLPENAIRSRIDSISSRLQQSGLAGPGEKIAESARDMLSAETEEEIDSAAAEAKARINDAAVKGLIPEQTRDGLENDIDAISGLMKERKNGFAQGDQDGSPPEGAIKAQDDNTGSSLEQNAAADSGEKAVDQAGDMPSDKTAQEPGPEVRALVDIINSSLGQSGLADAGEDIMSSVRQMTSAGSERELDFASAEAQAKVGDAGQKGFITEDAENGLAEDIAELSGMLGGNINSAQQDPQGGESSGDYQQEMLSSIKGSGLGKEEQKALSRLTEALFNAQTAAQMEKLNEQVQERAGSSGQGASESNWPNKFAAEFQEMKEMLKMVKAGGQNAQSKNKPEGLENTAEDKAEEPGEQMAGIVESKTAEEAQEDTQENERKPKDKPDFPSDKFSPGSGKKPVLQIDLLPHRVVVHAGGYVFIRPVAVYNGVDIRNISAEAEWFSRDPAIARVDQKGAVIALAPGDTEIFCRFKGIESRKAGIKVTAAIQEGIYKTLKSELKK